MWRPVLLALLLAACGEPGGQNGPEIPPPGEYGEGCPLESRVGEFAIARYESYSSVSGSVADGVLPVSVLEEVGREGDCVLMLKENPLCSPACVPGETCSLDRTCVPYPAHRSVGTVVTVGLTVDIVMEPNAVNDYSDTDVPHDLFETGETIQIVAEGDELEGFALDGAGVEQIVADTDWTIACDEPMDLSWTPSDGPGRILFSVNVDQHGNSPVTLLCDFEDTGEAVVPATLVNELLGFGISGVTTTSMSRQTIDSAEISAGCVEARVLSQLRGRVPSPGPC